jgi:hypothetical protein
MCSGLNLRAIQPSGGFCEHGNEPSGSIKYGEFLDHCDDQLIHGVRES